ncbi:MAG: chitobiase/beta-hexosaminidase C-terminal domain-containing protein [Candidatus Korobacteraceae bacterium]
MTTKAFTLSPTGNLSRLRITLFLVALCAAVAAPVNATSPSDPSQPVTATPTFSPAQGTFTSDQMVTISDATGGAVIYYTTDGSDPYTGSPVYSAPIPINQTTVLKAFAIAPGDLPSFTATSLYTITSGGGGSVNYGLGFTSQGLALNGAASINGNALQLTDGNSGERASAWYTTKVNVQAFTQDFSLLLSNARGDGMTFVIQNSGQTAIGPGGAGLGYGATSPGGTLGIPASVAVKFDLYNNFGEGSNSTGLYLNGASPTIPAVNMNGSGVSLHSGDVLNVHMTYDGFTLSMTITDTVTTRSFIASWQVDIPSLMGGTTAYVGFTGASGGATATQQVLNWTFASPFAVNYGRGFTSNGLSLNGNSKLFGTRLRLTDGMPSEISSAYFNTPVNVATFSTNFGFQDTQANGDGLTFVIQNAGATALGPGGAGLGYGATQPSGRAGIPTSVAIKLDLYNNQGEGRDSTGLYTDGASPTIPALDMTSSGINLRNGHMFNMSLSYDGTTLTLRITDIGTRQNFTTTFPIDIPGTVGGNTAYVGFTGSSGGATAIQEIINWTFGP